MRLPAAPPYFARFHPLLSSGILFLERFPFRRSSESIPYPYPVLRMFFPDHQPQRQSGIAYFPNQKIDIDRSMQFPIRRMVIITFHNSFFPSIIPRLYRKFQPGCSQRQSIDNASIYSIINYVATKNILNAPTPREWKANPLRTHASCATQAEGTPRMRGQAPKAQHRPDAPRAS